MMVLLAAALGVIEDQRRAELADAGGREARRRARGVQDRLLVEVVAGEVLVDVAQHGVVLEERRHGCRRAPCTGKPT